MSEFKSNAEIVRDLAASALAAQEYNSVPYIVTPENYKVHDLDYLSVAPRRIKSTQTVQSLESFINYIKTFHTEASAAFYKNHTLTAIIDFHAQNTPDWGEHIIQLTPTHSVEWSQWIHSNKSRMKQRDFLHFIEDNILDITSPDHTDLLFKIAHIKVGKNGGVESKISDHEETQAASKSVRLESGMPGKIELGVAPFKYTDKYKLEARIFTHIEEAKITFSYHLINHEKILDAVWDGFIDEIKQHTAVYV